MGNDREDWIKIRGKADHFSLEELNKIKQLFMQGKTIVEAAKIMSSSCRTIGDHFRKLKAQGLVPKPMHQPANYTARLYKPNWDL